MTTYAPTRIASTVTASGAAVVGKHNPVDATAGALSISLPTGQRDGARLAVEKYDSSTNAVTVTGNMRGSAGASISLVLVHETIEFVADSAGSWWPVLGHKTLTGLDGRFAGLSPLGIYQVDTQVGANDNAKIAAALAAATVTGGTVVFGDRTYTKTSPWLAPNDGASSPAQKSVHLRGTVATASGNGSAPIGGTIINDTSVAGGGAVAKWDTRGHGLLSVEDITFRDTSGGNTPFFQTTNTTLRVLRCAFEGSKSGTSCDQDAIILGGGTRTIDGSSTAKYDGYGSTISDCFFNHIRRAVWLRAGANDVRVCWNTIWSQSGAPDNTYGAIQLDGDPVGSIVGSLIEGNTIEMVNYPIGIRVGNYAKANYFLVNGIYDTTGTSQYGIFFDDSATANYVLSGYSNDAIPYMKESGLSFLTNTFATPHSNVTSVESGPKRFMVKTQFMTQQGGPDAYETGGGRSRVRPTNAATSSGVVQLNLVTAPAGLVTDGALTTGSNVVTSASNGFANAVVGLPIGGTGIPSLTYIQDVAPGGGTITMSRVATATSTGNVRFASSAAVEQTEMGFKDRHMLTQGTTPTSVVQAAAGSGPTLVVTGTDTAGKIVLTTGTGAALAAADLGQVVFATVTGSGLGKVILTPADAVSANLRPYAYTSITSRFAFGAGQVPAASTVYTFYYHMFE